MNKFLSTIFVFILLSCTNSVKEIKNEKYKTLTMTHQLVCGNDKKFALDDVTAPKPMYIQVLSDATGNRMLTLLNKYKNAIYFYNYENAEYLGNICYDKEGPNGVLGIAGYYIKNMDSIYLYNRPLVEIVLTDSISHIKERISLKGHEDNWFHYYPQYDFKTVCPIIETSGKLLLTGFNPFELKDSLIHKFHFTACIHLDNNQVEYHHTYPHEIYGDNANWGDPAYMQVYPTLSPNGELIHSFTASYNLYISKWNSDVAKVVYGGGNFSKKISSIDWDATNQNVTPTELLYTHFLQQDLYAAILYDPWRNVYYRFMQQGIADATTKMKLDNKDIIIIIMDEKFNYLGEENIGNGSMWNWNNSFVTEEGLNIEYIDANDINENFLCFKIFNLNKYE